MYRKRKDFYKKQIDHITHEQKQKFLKDLDDKNTYRGNKFFNQNQEFVISEYMQRFFTFVLLFAVLCSYLSQNYEAKTSCFVHVFSKDDKTAASCVHVFKGYFYVYAGLNVILCWRYYFNVTKEKWELRTRRSNKNKMRCMVFYLYPLLYINYVILVIIWRRVIKLRSSYESVEYFAFTVFFLIIITTIHGFFISF
jgi:hypothetical protein